MKLHGTLYRLKWVMMASLALWVFPVVVQAATYLHLEQELHFDDPEGKDVEIGPGIYEVSHGDKDQLRLSQAGKDPIFVQAQLAEHTEPITDPWTTLLPDETDPTLVNVMLLMPGGTGWEAIGSTTGIQGRGKIKLSRKKRNISRLLASRIPKRPSPPPLPPAIPVPPDCPVVVPYEIFGYPPGVTDPKAATDGERIIGEFVAEIMKSYQPGCWPIKTILITGHSDKSPGGIQVDDYISVQRAVDAKTVLQQEFAARAAGMVIPPGYPNPADMNFIVGGIGARQLDPNGPPQQPENRRINLLSYQLPATIEENTTRTGTDFQQHMLSTYLACRSFCTQTLQCRAYTFKKPLPGQTQGQCFLKKGNSKPSRDPKSISGLTLPSP